MKLHRTRGPACASDLQIDRWLAEELDDGSVARLEGHLAACARCQARLEDIRSSRAVSGGVLPREIALHARSARRGPWSRWGARAGSVLALAAATVLVLRASHRDAELESGEGERAKGAGHVAFYVMHDGRAREGSDGERLAPGDAIEFAYTARVPGYLAIVSVDGAKHANVYYASEGRAARIEPGSDVSLPQSTVLDGTLGEESVYALFCASAVSVETLRTALEADPARQPDARGCKVDRHTFVKVAR